MRVFVTGWAGYIGPVLVRRLREAGHYVVGLDTGYFLPNYAEVPTWPNKVYFDDLRNVGRYSQFVDVVVHLAGLSNDPMGDLDEVLTHEINESGTMAAIESFPNARHVVVSSCSVYGATTELATEKSPARPLTAYARAKRFVDGALAFYDNAVALRLGTVYGYSPGHRLDLVVNRMVWDALNLGMVTATGNAARPLVHVEDVADAILFMLDRPETGIYNVVGENVRMHDLAQTIGNLAGVPVAKEPSGSDARDYMASGSKLLGLGWGPQRSVLGSLPVLFERTAQLPAGQYTRLPVIRNLIENGRLTVTPQLEKAA